jgi:hypothetical protein
MLKVYGSIPESDTLCMSEEDFQFITIVKYSILQKNPNAISFSFNI